MGNGQVDVSRVLETKTGYNDKNNEYLRPTTLALLLRTLRGTLARLYHYLELGDVFIRGRGEGVVGAGRGAGAGVCY